ncbi:membrane hypothetical protein [Rhodospirillaceae bacterium LM-1]|nr:membrane hypothetical protein [Rhodospirillaceae bacterium LM-1]
MDFFKAQDRSRQRTALLILWFAPAILALFFGSHLIAVMVFRAIPFDMTAEFQPLYSFEEDRRHALSYLFWHPRVIAAGQIPAALIFLAAIVSKWRELSLGGGALLMDMLGARRLSALNSAQERRFRNVVAELAIASGIATPVLYVLEKMEGINALCAGFGPGEAVIGVTPDALQMLSRDELQGLAAHEFGHIANDDLSLNMRLASLMNGFTRFTLIGLNLTFFSGAGLAIGGIGLEVKIAEGAVLFVLGFLTVFIGMWVMIAGGFGLILGRAAQRAISREREFLADASAVQFARLSSGLSGALQKARHGARQNERSGKPSSWVRHMLFHDSQPDWLATHPPIEDRLSRLAQDHSPKQISRADSRAEPQPPISPKPYESDEQALAGLYSAFLLDHQGDLAPHIHMLAGLESPTVALLVERNLPVMGNGDHKAARLLISQSLAHLQRMDIGERDRIVRNAERLAMGDGALTAQEEALLQGLRSALYPIAARKSADDETKKRAMALAAASVAQAGHESSDKARQAYARAQEMIGEISDVDFRPSDQIGPWEFSQALEILAALPEDKGRQLMTALKAAAMLDGVNGERAQNLLDRISQATGQAAPAMPYDGLWR